MYSQKILKKKEIISRHHQKNIKEKNQEQEEKDVAVVSKTAIP